MSSSYGTDAAKSALRDNISSVQQSLRIEQKRTLDDQLQDRLWELPAFLEAPVVLTYVSIEGEVDTRALIDRLLACGRRVAVPKCNPTDHTLTFYEIASTDELARGYAGILEPQVGEDRMIATDDMVGSCCVVPGLVFDSQGYRVGRGGGYYDRFLAFYPGKKVGVAYASQLGSNPLPHDDNDIPVDCVVTESGVWVCG